jgi:hypothetical protein
MIAAALGLKPYSTKVLLPEMAEGDEIRLGDDEVREMVSRAALERQTGEYSPLLNSEAVEASLTRWVGEAPVVRGSERVREATTTIAKARRWRANLEQLFEEEHVMEATALLHIVKGLVMPRVAGGAGFVMAGGYVCSFADTGQLAEASQDIDFFPVGMSAAGAEQRVNLVIDLFKAIIDPAEEEHRPLDPTLWLQMAVAQGILGATIDILVLSGHWNGVHVYRTPNAVTVDIPEFIRLQFITRLYPTREAVVRDFDIAPCQVLFDGFDLFMTELATFAFWTGLFPPELDHCVCPATYARRVGKYLNRGWRLVLPDLDPNVETPYLLPGLGTELRRGRGAAELVMRTDCFDDTWSLALDGESLKRLWNTSAFEHPPGEPNAVVMDLGITYEMSDDGHCMGDHAGLLRSAQYPAPGYHLEPAPYLYRTLHYDPTTCAIANLRALLKDDPWRVYYWDDEVREWRVCCDCLKEEDIDQLAEPEVNGSCRAMYQRWISLGTPSIEQVKEMLRTSPPPPGYGERPPLERETIPEHVWYGPGYCGASFLKYAGFRR